MKFIDTYNVSVLKEQGIKEVFSYDRHYEKIEWVNRVAP